MHVQVEGRCLEQFDEGVQQNATNWGGGSANWNKLRLGFSKKQNLGRGSAKIQRWGAGSAKCTKLEGGFSKLEQIEEGVQQKANLRKGLAKMQRGGAGSAKCNKLEGGFSKLELFDEGVQQKAKLRRRFNQQTAIIHKTKLDLRLVSLRNPILHF